MDASLPLLGVLAEPPPSRSPPPSLGKPPSLAVSVWPRSAQWTTAGLLVLALSLLGWHVMGALRWGARPTDFVTEPERIDLNRADRAQLLQLPGVGETLADRIEEYRRSHKGFQNVDELRQVRGIGLALLKRLRPLLEVQPYVAPDDAQDAAPPAATTTPKARKNAAPKAPKAVAPTAPTAKKKGDGPAEPINVNTASAEELQQLPHIGPTISARILQAREQRPFQSVDELRHVKGIGPKIMDELRPFVKVN